MTRLGASLVDCAGAGEYAEMPIAPNEMAMIQRDDRFTGNLAGNRRAGADALGSASRALMKPQERRECELPTESGIVTPGRM